MYSGFIFSKYRNLVGPYKYDEQREIFAQQAYEALDEILSY